MTCIPVVPTGFPGAGKTTLLNRIFGEEPGRRCAVNGPGLCQVQP